MYNLARSDVKYSPFNRVLDNSFAQKWPKFIQFKKYFQFYFIDNQVFIIYFSTMCCIIPFYIYLCIVILDEFISNQIK